MAFYLLDENLAFASAPLERFSSLSWSVRWYEPGEFTLIGASDLFKAWEGGARWIWNEEREELGRIEGVRYENSRCTLSGRLAESLLERRVVTAETALSGSVQSSAASLMASYAANLPHYGGFANSTLSETADGIIRAGANLGDELYSLLKPLKLSVRASFDGDADKGIRFALAKGKDRTQEQSVNSWAIFSQSFENIAGVRYERSEKSYRNVLILTASYNKDVTVTVRADKRQTGEDAREAAASVSLDAGEMTQAAFTAALQGKAEEMLAEYQLEETIDGTVAGTANLQLERDYSVGDFVDVSIAEIGLTQSAQVTGADIVYENGARAVYPQLGSDRMNLRRLIRRENERI